MIPVEYMWFVLALIFCVIGSARGLAKELGTSSVLLISLFTLYIVWDKFIAKLVQNSQATGAAEQASTVHAAYFGIAILFVAYISYQGYVLTFPFKEAKGLFRGLFGLLGGALNSYLVVGTLWDVVAHAGYFRLHAVACCPSHLHDSIIRWLPVTLMHEVSPFVLLVPGVLLLLLILLK